MQVIVDNGAGATVAMTMLSVSSDVFLVTVDDLEVGARSRLGFGARAATDPVLGVTVARLTGSGVASIVVPAKVRLALGAGPQLILGRVGVRVGVGGELTLPPRVVIEADGSLDAVGVLGGVTEVVVRGGGVLRLAAPASTKSAPAGTVRLAALRLEFRGVLRVSSQVGVVSAPLTLLLLTLYAPVDVVLDPLQFAVSPQTQTVQLYPQLPPIRHVCEPINDSLVIAFGQHCHLAAGEHHLDLVVVETGGELELAGNSSRGERTTLYVARLVIRYGGALLAVGAGYEQGGPGAGLRAGEGGSHGGDAAGVTGGGARSYGEPTLPLQYGSNGFGAANDVGYGGGQLEVVIGDTFVNDGLVSFDGGDGGGDVGGGSGGSLLVRSDAVEGSGSFRARGGENGGGGGRIAFHVTRRLEDTFSGSVSVSGATGASTGKAHANARHYL